MRVTRVDVERRCAVCERTLLMGERALRFSPDGGEEFVDVCQLCQDAAFAEGWLKEGAPTTPTISADRKRSRFSLGNILGVRTPAEAPVLAEPNLRRLSEAELSIVEA